MEKTYDHKIQENQIYQKWEKAGVFSPEGAQKLRDEFNLPTKKETFSVLMPPPNANAPLHCGHATYAIQDLMIRLRRMQGYQALYFPGTDHAGFETQVVYERKLKKEGKTRFDFDRQTLYNDILNFVKENSDLAISQLKRLGMSADWGRNTFMLDPFVVDTVYNTFIKMHNESLIYRDDYMVNYSPFHGTTFSNLETVHVEQNSPLFYVRYKLEDSDDYITVATTRPETIYADVAIAVNPKDGRYKNHVGKNVINPLNGRKMEIIADSYVDVDFGTGALKITPAHDFNDYEIGKKHNLPIISLVDLEGRMTEEAGELKGLFVNKARARAAEILQEKGALVKTDEKYINNVLVDYKDSKPIEPMLLPNWFIKMESLARAAVDAIEKGEVKFYLPLWKKEIIRWLKEGKDWPISRQTVFGIRIPVWYNVEANKDLFVVFLDKAGKSHEGLLHDFLRSSNEKEVRSISEAYSFEEIETGLQKIITPKDVKYVVSKTKPNKPSDRFLQETDTFDTWFSSGQWPLTTTKYPDGEDFKKYFPTSFMDTMWDILFFWIARMIMFSLYLTGQVPFKQVYIHGTITDEKGQKMSKSRGNAIDPLSFVEEYSADALRMAILVGGNTSAHSTALGVASVKGYRNFANKIWNMGRFINLMCEAAENEKMPVFSGVEEIKKLSLQKDDGTILAGFAELVKSVNKNLEKYRFRDAGDAVYQFMWHELADKYIEQVKVCEDGKEEKLVGLGILLFVYLNCLKLLHPYMPFVTEAIWAEMPKPEGYGDLIAVSDWPTF